MTREIFLENKNSKIKSCKPLYANSHVCYTFFVLHANMHKNSMFSD